VLGDYLSERENPLAIAMRLRHGGEPLELTAEAVRSAIPGAGRKLVVLIHGLCMTDLQWTRVGHDHGAALARDLGYTPVYVHYNTGLHVSSNGRQLAAQLDELVRAWPTPLDELVVIGHSMGGLVARSAIHAGEQAGHAWRSRLRALITLGTPHHGAALERTGHWIDRLFEISRYSAPLGRLGRRRSAGITDLRFGNVLDEHWQGADPFEQRRDRRCPLALPADVACYAIAGTSPITPGDRLPGDGLVVVDSALGVHHNPELTLAFPDAHRWIAVGVRHTELLGSPEVYATILSWLSTPDVPGLPANVALPQGS
jgi:pimeloyl-ACP methyl ester carboxylesterase